MLLEIQDIETNSMGAIVMGLRGSGMPQLAECLMLWSFELEWDEIPDTVDITRFKQLLDIACHSYTLKLGAHELSKSQDTEEACDDL